MLGIVIVSHSEKLAHEVIELCREVKQYDFPLLNGSGTDGGHLGSDPMRIKEAIQQAYTDDGVLIFADIGSSILNSEMAIEFLEMPYDKTKVKIADAAIVEGAIVTMAINDEKATMGSLLNELAEFKSVSKLI
ncbi:diguanylate cyclase [Testudinibacter sp. TR-2022]|uniref:dihydroxyacetone kinase phosphoryl donor subunit DhaM n=1 Tax=Testudinibacter sp. TR-2022 TaxID=2585029 RepID=UPI001119A595|nr:dihydroxyacetone kinase phosphoryl donor subunit DhaM [Testudinibacter sp. TR-2022]TNH05371.1 diguanylate cyclase [Pasteurellaceae bacterium Phil31]TNH07058.1 diguanylate cyclase [Testudinibacter sp. TR-2022]TNH12174.1 diguanylate cyclase [Testudinibacter sp. TR-2022]TNH14828.1 diguanylate cyclase [Testudinibacter sp. TR-2022]TNH15464.1 diguanylate cyclase [Testudinibacter sp. TR-2022]